MAKKITGYLKLQVPAGAANPSPPIGPALGQRGLNIMQFCKDFNAASQDLEKGSPIPVVLTIYADRSFSFEMKTPPVSHFLKKAAGLAKGSQTPGRGSAGRVTRDQVRSIAEQKLKDLNAGDVDARHADQMVRGVVNLPNGTGRTVRVAVFARGDKAEQAKAAGADIVGAEDLVESVQKGDINFDRCIATPDMMALVGRLGKVLGPRGLMPNPKVGTVTNDVAQAVKDAKGGAVEFRVEKAGIIHAGIGKASFSEEALLENIRALTDAVTRAKPSGAKGTYLKRIAVASTQGPGVRVDPASLAAS